MRNEKKKIEQELQQQQKLTTTSNTALFKSHNDSDFTGLDPPNITSADKNLPPSRD
jgi:hypothetical protein